MRMRILIVASDQAQVVIAQAEQRDGLRDRHVNLLGGVDRAGPRAALICRKPRFARHRQRHQIRRRSSARQAADKSCAADGLRQPADDYMLDGRRRRTRTPRRGVLIEHAGQQIGRRRYRLTRTEDVAEEARAVRPARVNDFCQIVERALAHSLLGQLARKPRLRLCAGHVRKAWPRRNGRQVVQREARDARKHSFVLGLRPYQCIHER